MLNDNTALAARFGAPSEDDYQAFCDALSSSARGRWFLAEYSRRNRHADTEILLEALARLEAHIHADASAAERLRDQLRLLLIAIRLARPDIDAAVAPAKAEKLAALLLMLEQRIDAMTDGPADGLAAKPAPPANDALGAHAMPEDADPGPRLVVVPPPDEPELPIPSPAAIQPPVMTVVGIASLMPSPFDPPAPPVAEESAPAAPVAEGMRLLPEPVIEAASPEAERPVEYTPPAEVAEIADPIPIGAIEEELWALSAAKLTPPPDPLAALKLLSEDERIALFT